MEPFSFIHASDIHLGAGQFSNNYRAHDFLGAFQQVLDYAKLHNVDFILLGGDVFTSQEILPEYLAEVIKRLKIFYGETSNLIPIFAVEGNHDIRKHYHSIRLNQTQSWLRVLASLNLIHLLENISNPASPGYRIKDCRIYGMKYTGSQTEIPLHVLLDAIPKDPALFTILLMHFGIRGQMQGVPGVPLQQVLPLRDHINYLGLGHYHLNFALGGWIYNPGSTEANAAIEATFRRGVYLVKGGGSYTTPNVQLLPLANRKFIYHEIMIPVTVRTEVQLLQHLISALQLKISPRTPSSNYTDLRTPFLSLVLRGLTRGMKEFNLDHVKYELLNRFGVLDIRIYSKTGGDLLKTPTLFDFINVK